MSNLNYDEMVNAMRTSDAAYDGRFYVGVHSTRIYCLPSCPAKLPLLKNVSFYLTREEAIAAGLRGCKRCKSQNYPDTLPAWLDSVLGYMTDHQTERLNETKLMQMTGVDISTVRRYFKNQLQTTPLAFHRKLRLDHARRLIESGSDYLNAAFECGYESSSGFREAFMRQFGHTPGRIYVDR